MKLIDLHNLLYRGLVLLVPLAICVIIYLGGETFISTAGKHDTFGTVLRKEQLQYLVDVCLPYYNKINIFWGKWSKLCTLLWNFISGVWFLISTYLNRRNNMRKETQDNLRYAETKRNYKLLLKKIKGISNLKLRRKGDRNARKLQQQPRSLCNNFFAEKKTLKMSLMRCTNENVQLKQQLKICDEQIRQKNGHLKKSKKIIKNVRRENERLKFHLDAAYNTISNFELEGLQLEADQNSHRQIENDGSPSNNNRSKEGAIIKEKRSIGWFLVETAIKEILFNGL